MLLMAADRNEVTQNEIRDNRSVGLAVVSLRIVYPDRPNFDVGTEPDDNRIHDNTIQHNGADPSPEAVKFGLPGADLLWDGSGSGNSWQESATNRFPPWLPDPTWNDFMRRAYGRLLGLARRFL